MRKIPDTEKTRLWRDLNEIKSKLEHLINATPTSIARNALCDANILLNKAEFCLMHDVTEEPNHV